jgi:signal transduction histidine kinase
MDPLPPPALTAQGDVPAGWRPLVQLCMACHIPMLLALGAGPQLVYNQAFGVLAGNDSAGLPQLWSRLAPLFEAVRSAGAAQPPLLVVLGRPVAVHCSPLLADDGVAVEGVLCICTEVPQDAEALQRLQAQVTRVSRATALGQLSASITHEISQPLAAAAASAGAVLRWLAADPPNVAEAIAAAGHVMRDTDRAAEIVWRTRNFLQFGPGVAQTVDLPALANDVIAMAHGELLNRKAQVTLVAPAGLPRVRVDRVQLQQVLLNLLLNAMDAVRAVAERDRGIAIEIAGNAASEVEVAVKDRGRGMTPEQQLRIFEPFYTTKPSGIGMGLTISRNIVEAYQGRLWAESGPQGTTFRFTLPIAGARLSAG